ncbi:MAG TPA: hypothetical protein VMV03_02010 [Spirochaetia bacterium]|nr:hypothetical protein [Spirochaetia bacterium]
MGVRGEATFQIVQGQGYGPKEQGGGGGELYCFFPFSAWLGMAATFGLFETVPSDATGGFVYRGYGTGVLGASLEAKGPIADLSGLGRLMGGGSVGAAAAWAAYQYTTLYFFYPEVLAEGFLDFAFSGLPSLHVRFSLPLAAQFRRDLDYSFSASLGLGVIYAFGGNP